MKSCVYHEKNLAKQRLDSSCNIICRLIIIPPQSHVRRVVSCCFDQTSQVFFPVLLFFIVCNKTWHRGDDPLPWLPEVLVYFALFPLIYYSISGKKSLARHAISPASKLRCDWDTTNWINTSKTSELLLVFFRLLNPY